MKNKINISIAILAFMLLIGLTIILGKITAKVKDQGLKAILTEIWEGEE